MTCSKNYGSKEFLRNKTTTVITNDLVSTASQVTSFQSLLRTCVVSIIYMYGQGYM